MSMTGRLLRFLALLAVAAMIAAGLAACSQKDGPDIIIASGSENTQLEPIVQEFCAAQRAKCRFAYMGSLDMGFGLKPGGKPLDADIVWPAASIWIDLFDEGRKVKHLQSISQSPVILGVRLSKARALGWTGHDVSTADILAAVRQGRLKFLMSSATQSNSGAGAYLAMLTAALGGGDVLTEPDLARADVRDEAKALLAGVERTAGSSGWLADLFLGQDKADIHYDAMWNYESVLKETNDALVAAGSEPLWLVYPKDGVSISDSPLGYLDRGRGSEVETFVLDLQKFLLSDPIRKRIAATGRRTGPGESAPPVAQWNFDPARSLTAIRPPEPRVIWAALNLYQEALRRPSLTALCLDVSGSMAGKGIDQLHQAMDFLFTPGNTQSMLVQWSAEDKIVAMSFSSEPGEVQTATGASADQQRLRSWGLDLDAGGGTDMYACADTALEAMAGDLARDKYLPAIVIMTDGQSEDNLDAFLQAWRSAGARIPVFGITFGEADRRQLDRLAAETGGRVFDGRSGLVEAFRAVRGYN